MEKKSRIIALDVLRGFALLGIPLMNVQSFAMVGQAYLNPTAYGDLTGVNLWVWVFSHCFADQKFMTLFSMLFGASILLITSKYETKGISSLGVHYRRNFWLLIIGLLHAYLIWYGDILAPYAVCAFIIYPFRKLSTQTLFILGITVFSIGSLLEMFSGINLLNATTDTLQSMSGGWNPTSHQIQSEINAYQGTYLSQLSQRAHTALMMETTYFIHHFFWRICGLMLLGMSFFKSGFLTGKLKSIQYKKIALIIGIPSFLIIISGILFNFWHDWDVQYAMLLGSQFNYWGSLGLAMTYACVVILLCQYNVSDLITDKLSAVGRMALSNYLFQSTMMAIIFYGFGFFGEVERAHQLLIVIALVSIQLWYSPIWLRYFHYGPMEWVWRSLTNKKIEIFKKHIY